MKTTFKNFEKSRRDYEKNPRPFPPGSKPLKSSRGISIDVEVWPDVANFFMNGKEQAAMTLRDDGSGNFPGVLRIVPVCFATLGRETRIRWKLFSPSGHPLRGRARAVLKAQIGLS